MTRTLNVEKPATPFSARSLVIRASAGTGKTFQLTNSLLRLLLRGVPPRSILATTFTRKAAGEILDRVLARLAAATESDARTKELATQLGISIPSREKIIQLLSQLLRQIDQLRVSTLDSYFQKAAQSFAFELGLPFGWDLLEEGDASHLQSDAIRRVLRESTAKEIINLMHSLDKGDLSWRVASQIRGTIDATHKTFLRSTTDAWETITPGEGMSEEEIDNAIGELESLKVPSRKRFATEKEEAIKAAKAGSFEHFLKQGVGKKLVEGEDKYDSTEIPAEWRLVYEKLIVHARANALSWIAQKNKATADLVSKFETQYQIAKRAHRQYEFDDIPRKLASALRSPESHGRLAFRLDGGVEHLLLDEFQDTSAEQWRVLEATAKRVSDQSEGTFLCVGDVKQAIYGWRGGSARIFGAIEEQLQKVSVDHLVESRRSAPEVIDAVNQVMAQLPEFANGSKDAAGIREWVKGFKSHTTFKADAAGWVTLREVSIPEGEEAAKAKLDAALKAAADIAEQAHKAAPSRSIAILFRSNAPIGRMVSLLRSRQLEASEEGGTSLLDSAAVETVLSLIQLADHPGDSVARFHLETGPLGKELSEGLKLPAKFAADLRRTLATEGYGDFVREWSQRLAPYLVLRDATRLEQLVELACDYDAKATLRPRDFVRYITEAKTKDVSAGAIRVMTIHQSKGLEFDTVILPELDKQFKGREPSCVAGGDDFLEPATRATRWIGEAERALVSEAIQKDHDHSRDERVQESLCTLYVAMTRAAHALHMIIPATKAESKSTTKSKWSDLLRYSLAPKQGETEPIAVEGCDGASRTLYSDGDPQWHRHLKSPVKANAVNQSQPDWPAIAFATPSKPVLRNLPRKKPSTVAEEASFNPSAAFNTKSTDSTRFGTAIHYWFEQIEWLEAAKTHVPVADLAINAIAQPNDNLSEWQTKFTAYLKLQGLTTFLDLAAFKKKFGVTGDLLVTNEQSIAFLDGPALLSGQIDRLVFEMKSGKSVRAWIIDYKTDKTETPEKLQERIAHHRVQLEAYQRGIAAIYHLPLSAIEAYLVMLDKGEVVNVTIGVH